MTPQSRPRIGRKIRRAMERKRLDQGDVAEALGVSRSAVNAWINNRAWPANSIGALEELLDVELDDAEDEPETPEETARLRAEVDALKQESRAWRELAERLAREKNNGDSEPQGRRAG